MKIAHELLQRSGVIQCKHRSTVLSSLIKTTFCCFDFLSQKKNVATVQLDIAVMAVLFGKNPVKQSGVSLDDRAFLTFSKEFY